MSKQFEGEVVAKARNGKGIAFNVDGDDQWFNAKDESQIPEDVAKGDVVSFEYSVTRKGGRTFNNIEGEVEILEKGDGGGSSRGGGGSRGGGRSGGGERGGSRSGGSAGGGSSGRRSYGGGSGGGDKDRQIVRQNALTQANKLVETFPNLVYTEGQDVAAEVAEQIIELAKVFEGYVFS